MNPTTKTRDNLDFYLSWLAEFLNAREKATTTYMKNPTPEAARDIDALERRFVGKLSFLHGLVSDGRLVLQQWDAAYGR